MSARYGAALHRPRRGQPAATRPCPQITLDRLVLNYLLADLRQEIELMHLLRMREIIVMFETDGIGQTRSEFARTLSCFKLSLRAYLTVT